MLEAVEMSEEVSGKKLTWTYEETNPSAITSRGSVMCESLCRIIQTGNFATGYTKFSKKFSPRSRDDWVAETRLEQKRWEDSLHSKALRAKFLMRCNCFRAAFGVRRVLASL
jgi:hypothetical protein